MACSRLVGRTARTHSPSTMETPQRKRRIKLVNPRLQLRLVGAFAGLCVITLLVQGLLFGAFLSQTSASMSVGGNELAAHIPGILGKTVGLSLALVLPCLVLIGVHLTFRTAGALYRFQKHLESVIQGEWSGPCQIRKDDELQDFCTLLNEGLEAARKQGEQASLAKGTFAEEERLAA